ncbi:MAG: B12-binding domain-containing radical SAM protein [Bacteroidia bacterium]|nr:B12-binding domain-containing radical SAM protein [Bacteroidia bacterium]
MMTSTSGYSLLLVNPKSRYNHYSVQNETASLLGKKKTMTPLALPLLAALTPKHYNITIIDEDIKPLPDCIMPDIVGITFTSPTTGRAFEIADHFKTIGSTVVMGGASASFNQEETLKHADSLVVGEAERIWAQLLHDFETKILKKIYQSQQQFDFENTPVPRWDLLDTSQLMAFPVEASRGCPYNCRFCLTTKMFGNKQRYKDIDNVIEEIDQLPEKRMMFTDDNLTYNKEYALELMKRLKPLNAAWTCQSSIEIAEHDYLLKAMAEAGCNNIIIGFESLNPNSLAQVKKFHNKVEKYEAAIDKIHSCGIYVAASMIIGFDSDNLNDIDLIRDFILRNNIFHAQISLLDAINGTELYFQMKNENRLLNINKEYKCGIFPSLKYKNFTSMEIFDKYFFLSEQIKSYENVTQMAVRIFNKYRFTNAMDTKIGFLTKFKTSFVIIKNYLLTKKYRNNRNSNVTFVCCRI